MTRPTLEYARGLPREWVSPLCTLAFGASLVFLLCSLVVSSMPGLHNEYDLLPFGLIVGALATIALLPVVRRARDKNRLGRIVRTALILWTIGAALCASGAHSKYFGEDPHLTARRLTYCTSRLSYIGEAMKLYASEHDGKYPDSLADLLRTTPDAAPEHFICSAVIPYWTPAGSRAQTVADLQSGKNQHHHYLAKGMTSDVSPDTVLVHDNPANWSEHGGGMSVLFADGKAIHLERREATNLLVELAAGHNPPRPGCFVRPR